MSVAHWSLIESAVVKRNCTVTATRFIEIKLSESLGFLKRIEKKIEIRPAGVSENSLCLLCKSLNNQGGLTHYNQSSHGMKQTILFSTQ